MSARTEMVSIPTDPAPRATMQDHVYERIKSLILGGDIEPGRSITIQSLATAFAVSHMPVREALKRLVAEHALTVVSGRSMGVPPLTRERLEDLRRVRVEVEGLAVAWAARLIQPQTVQHLERLYARLEKAVKGGDIKEYLHANKALHFTVYGASGSPTLLSMIESLWLQISPYFNLLHASGNYTKANVEHRALVEALRRGDPKAARQAIRGDINGAASVLSTALR